MQLYVYQNHATRGQVSGETADNPKQCSIVHCQYGLGIDQITQDSVWGRLY